MLTPEVHRRVRELFEIALDLDTDARTAFLRDACEDDPTVLREVQALLGSTDANPTDRLFPPLLAPNAGTPAIGQRIGPYTIRRQIGAGGMGIVYEAAREDIGKTIALKLVRHGAFASPEHLRRFRLEQRVLARLEHPNIARLLDAGLTDVGLPFLVMEYVEGEPIDRYCDTHRLSVEERLTLFLQVCDAVQYAHRHLVVHRDLKPSNILVSGDAPDPASAKLLDFGIAALLHEEAGAAEPRLTGTGRVVFTPEYAAPEQMRGEPASTASDVYALGVLLYELLSGHRPFPRVAQLTPQSLLAARKAEPDPPSRAVRREAVAAAHASTEPLTPEAIAARRRTLPQRLERRLRGDLDTIVLRALTPEPDRRYASVQALRDDIDRHLTGKPVWARDDSLWYRARKFVTRHAAGVAATALVVLTLAGGVVATTVQARRADAARAVAERRFGDMRSLAGALVSDVHDAINDLPGTLPVRAELVTRALEHLQQLEREAGDDRALKRQIAESYWKLGRVQGNPTSANLGDAASARTSFTRALSIVSTLVATDSTDRAARRTLALVHESMSDADAFSGDLQGGARHARQAVDQWRWLAASDSASVSARAAVSMSHIKLGDMLGNPFLPNLGDRMGATAEYRRALTLMDGVPADSLKPWGTRRLLALVHERLGSMLGLEGRHAEAVSQLEQALVVREGLQRERGTSVDARRDVAVAHQLLCEAHVAAGNADAAYAECRRGLEMYEELRAADPENVQGLRDVSLGLQSMHKALVARGALGEALGVLERSVGISRELTNAPRGSVSARGDLARGLLFEALVRVRIANGAGGEERASELRRAVRAYEEGRQLLEGVRGSAGVGEEERLLEEVRGRIKSER